ncbi:MAG: FAD-dependent oxidoreductase [Gammaproteobacteria bacterium]
MSSDFDIVVVGGGIAGLSAGLAAARLGRSTLVLTGEVLGGHLLNIDKIDGFPGFAEGVPGYDLCPIAQEQAMEAGAEFQMTSLSSLEPAGDAWALESGDTSYSARSVILATGTRLLELDVPGESLLRGKGVSQCASCDAPLLRDRDVVVAGGGDSALQEALTLAEHCAAVTIVHHGEAYSAQAAYRKLIEANAKVTAIRNAEITEILGEDAVEGASVSHIDSGETSSLSCAAVFVFIGLQPNTGFIEDDSMLDGDRRIITDTEMRTTHKGLLAAGTVRAAGTGRAVAAAGDGASAALSADRYLSTGEWQANG